MVIADLVRGGFSLSAIQARTGVPESTIRGWRNIGAEPMHEAGERLILLWCNATAKDRSNLPTKSRPPKPAGFRRSSWIQLGLVQPDQDITSDGKSTT